MSDIETIYRNWVEEVWNEGNEEAIEKYFDLNGVANYPYLAGQGYLIHGLEDYKKFFRLIRERYSDLRIEIDEITSENDRVTALSSIFSKGVQIRPEGSNDSEGGRLPSLSRAVFRDGKIIEVWSDISETEDKSPVFSYLK